MFIIMGNRRYCGRKLGVNGIRQYRVESVRFIIRKALSNQCRPKSILTMGRSD